MVKPRQTDLELTPPQRAAIRRKTKVRGASTSRRRPLLMDYQTWIDMTANTVRSAPTAEAP
ncbi:hypothetical protein [Variovorax sp. dw_308]|uniref:hypothetical protein n=1 Tax=Variovorax sp. dw_308 TaxID=2721546 RepID=UPI001C473466|nr:hypothetical protein [Variovorax sp. dw_308]